MKKDRLYAYALSAVLLVGIGAAVIECSGGNLCGNGVKDDGEDCDHGANNGAQGDTCSAACKSVAGPPHASIQVFYQRLKVDVGDAYPNYPAPSCKDLGVMNAHLVLTGPSPADVMLPCSTTSMQWDPVTPGTYQAAITLLDANGKAVTKTAMSTMVDVQVGNQTNINVAFVVGDFLNSYTGNFDFVAQWGAANKKCADVTPNVIMETLKLVPQGQTIPVPSMTTTNHKLDGTPGSCFTPGTPAYEEAAGLPWGYYDFTITGQVAGGVTAYCKKFTVFTGPGVANPTYDLVVDDLSAVDGGAPCP
jgi:hypothetical protein